jgi:putative aldouronate transport system substrate-binding protein
MKSLVIKRTAAAIVAATVALSTSACSSTGKQATEAGKTPDTTSSDPLAKYSLPIDIKVARVSSDIKYLGSESADNNSWTSMYKDDLNINIKNMWVVDSTQAKTKLNTAIASGDYPDVFTVDIADYKKLSESGVIADVTSLYDKYQTAHMKEILKSDDGVALNSIKVGGKFYGIPVINNPYDSAYVLHLRKDWLTKLNLQTPKTVADLEKIADAFTNQDPDGNGKKDTYGLAFAGKEISTWFGNLTPFFEMYNAYPLGSTLSLVKDTSNKLVWGGSLPGMKPALTELQKFYNSGWLAQDFGTMDANKITTEVSSGRAGMYFAPFYGGQTVAANLLKANPNADIITVPIPGVSESTPGKAFMPNSLGTVAVVSSKCKNPEALFKIYGIGFEKVAYAKDDDTYNKFNGDNKDYTGWKLSIFNPLLPMKNYDNYQKVTAAVGKKDSTGLNAGQKLYYDRIINAYLGKPVDASNAEYVAGWGYYRVFADPNGGYAAIDKIIKTNSYVKDGFSGAPTENMSTKASTLTDLIKANIIKIIYGTATPDSWDSVVESWKTLGGNDILKDANDWLKSSGN